MNRSRLAASAAAVALVPALALALASPATAATPGVTFITAADVDQAATFTSIGWGDPGSGPLSSSINGMSTPTNANILYGYSTPIATAGGNALASTATTTEFTASSTTDLLGEISWFEDAALTQTFFVASAGGSAAFTDPAGLWQTTVAVGSIPAFTDATLAAFDAQLAADPAYADAAVIGVGFFNDGADANLYTFNTRGQDFTFLPAPAVTVTTTITQVDFGTAGKGFSLTTTGFVPNETISGSATSPSYGAPIGALTADANGAVHYNVVANSTTEEVGAWQVLLVGDISGTTQVFPFTVTTALAATGVEIAAPAIAALIALALGAFIIIARRRRPI